MSFSSAVTGAGSAAASVADDEAAFLFPHPLSNKHNMDTVNAESFMILDFDTLRFICIPFDANY